MVITMNSSIHYRYILKERWDKLDSHTPNHISYTPSSSFCLVFSITYHSVLKFRIAVKFGQSTSVIPIPKSPTTSKNIKSPSILKSFYSWVEKIAYNNIHFHWTTYGLVKSSWNWNILIFTWLNLTKLLYADIICILIVFASTVASYYTCHNAIIRY